MPDSQYFQPAPDDGALDPHIDGIEPVPMSQAERDFLSPPVAEPVPDLIEAVVDAANEMAWAHGDHRAGCYQDGNEARRTCDISNAKRSAFHAAVDALRAASEPVAEIVSSGPANMPLLRWLSADHSFRAPIGSRLYAGPIPAPEGTPDLRAAAQKLAEAGAPLATIAFNLKQAPGHVLTEHECEVLGTHQKAWDAARTAFNEASAALAAQPSTDNNSMGQTRCNPAGEKTTQAPAEGAPNIERDEQLDRDYIPLPGGWEVQTKGKGSTLRLLDKKAGERHPLPLPDFIVAFIERMAREVNAASNLQPKGTWHDEDPWTESQVNDIVRAVYDNCGTATSHRVRRIIEAAQAPAPAHTCNCPNIGCCDGSCAPYVAQRNDPHDPMLAQAWEVAKRLEPTAAELMRKLCKRLRDDDRMLSQTIDEREERQQFIDHLLDALHGPDRHEWTSAYGFNDAMEDALERLAALEALQAPHAHSDEHLMNFLAPWVIADDPKDRADFLAALRAALAGQSPAVAPAEPAAGSAEEFATSESPRCRDGGAACIDCLMQGQCMSKPPVQGTAP